MHSLEKKLVVTRLFDAPIEEVWKVWTDPEYVRQWWGPDHFTCPMAKIDFHVGGKSLVGMRAPDELGGQVHYNVWEYTEIIYLQRIEFVMNLADEHGVRQKPTEVGMPEYFPEDIRTVVTFEKVSNSETQMTVTEYAEFGPMTHFARLGLEQSLGKAVSIFKVKPR